MVSPALPLLHCLFRIRAQREQRVHVQKIIRGTRLTGGSASRRLTRGHSLDAYVHKLESRVYVHP